MKMKVMRDNPNTFDDAVKSATGEQNLRKPFTLQTGIEPKDTIAPREEEPMDISHTRPKITCFFCKKRGHRHKDCTVRMKNEATVNAAQRNEKQQLGKKPNIVCYNCQGIGHIARECPNSNFQVGLPQNQLKCNGFPNVEANAGSHKRQNKGRKIMINSVTKGPNSLLIKIGKQKYRALVDSGAEVSLIHRHVFHSLKNKPKLRKHDLKSCNCWKYALENRRLH